MKRVCTWFCSVVLILLCGTLFACSGDEELTNEELTNSEKNFVGTWVLEDITYVEFGKTQLWYPSNSNTFNTLCEQYLHKTKIVLDNTKKDGKISGTLIVESVEISFKWYGHESPMIINFSEYLSFSTYNGNTVSKGSTNTAMINTKGKLCINPNQNMIYIFKKAQL